MCNVRYLLIAQASLQGEMRELGAAITRDIFTENPNVRWEDISGLYQVGGHNYVTSARSVHSVTYNEAGR